MANFKRESGAGTPELLSAVCPFALRLRHLLKPSGVDFSDGARLKA
jgi:hypothetical protein